MHRLDLKTSLHPSFEAANIIVIAFIAYYKASHLATTITIPPYYRLCPLYLIIYFSPRNFNTAISTFQMVWKRLNDHGKNWRHVYKALVLLEYLLKTGSDRVALQCKENIYAIQTLKDFQYMEEGKDQGRFLSIFLSGKQATALC